MKTEDIFTDHVVIPKRLRHVNDDKVNALAKSMEAIGLQQPITVWHDGIDFFLVAGAHRLIAACKLGWESIDAFEMKADEIDRQLWEIDENLMRSELTATQQAEHLAKRKELWEAWQKSGPNCPTLTGRGNKGFAAETAEATGVSKRTVNRAVNRAHGVDREVFDEIRNTRWDRGQVLDELAKLPTAKAQKRRLREMRDEYRQESVQIQKANQEADRRDQRSVRRLLQTMRHLADALSGTDLDVLTSGFSDEEHVAAGTLIHELEAGLADLAGKMRS